MEKPPIGLVPVFLLFSLVFPSDPCRLRFKTDQYYQDLYNSLNRRSAIYPFREFFVRHMEDKPRWIFHRRSFGLMGIAAVLGADVFVVMANLGY